ncbi:MORN repeat-containing protein 2 isoform X1 [Alligator mississippiensis]|uniref:MORN repeat-containing protein 2 isoform X1 n=1 Tax=Alligator mississippiensis TaxID=8496 RepID=UPI002877E2E7|nr:MORN repeat-containing protein 2 isoform X1 [Alligator mississippiensis]
MELERTHFLMEQSTLEISMKTRDLEHRHFFTDGYANKLNYNFKIQHRHAPNLANLITRSKLPQAQNTPKGSRPCQDKKCKTCQHISTTPTITTPHNRAISIPGSYSCTSRNVIYLIQCTKCPDGRYVGETKQQLHTRMNARQKSIKDRNTQLLVEAHFSQEGHSLPNLSVLILKGNLHNTSQRRAYELHFINLLDTRDQGLNIDIGFLIHYNLPGN